MARNTTVRTKQKAGQDTLNQLPSVSLKPISQPSQWQFDAEVANNYDDMLARSIPQYATMRTATQTLARQFFQPGTAIIDLGCSHGESLASVLSVLDSPVTAIGVDTSEPMLALARQRFVAAPHVTIATIDLRHDYPENLASVTLAILTLQFIPIEHRQQLLHRIYEHTLPGGACLIVEKVLGASATIDDLMVAAYYGMKADNGYSTEEIYTKRSALEGVLVPLTAHWNEEMFRAAGFSQIDCYWRWMNFGGWLCVRSR